MAEGKPFLRLDIQTVSHWYILYNPEFKVSVLGNY